MSMEPRTGLRSIRRIRKRMAALIAIAASLALIGGVGTMTAATAAAGTEYAGFPGNDYFFGSHIFAGYSSPGYCITSGSWEPDGATPGYDVSDPVLGYVMGKYGASTDPATAAGVLYNLRKVYDNGKGPGEVDNWANGTGNGDAIRAAAAAELADAQANYGPYSTTLSTGIYSSGTGGTLSFNPVLSTPGNAQVGLPFTITVTNAVFTSTGTNTVSGSTSGGVMNYDWKSTANGEALFTVNVTTPGTTITRHDRSIPERQDVMVWGGLSSTSAQAADPVVFEYNPKVTTQTSMQNANVGAQISDVMTITAGPPNGTVKVHNTLYGPFDTAPIAGATAPVGAPVAATTTSDVTLDANGAATVDTKGWAGGLYTVTKTGYYVWQESIDAGATADGAPINAFKGQFGEATETSIVVHPEMVTQTSHDPSLPTSEVTDTINVTKAYAGFSGTITATLYGPMVPTPGTPCNAVDPAVWEKSITDKLIGAVKGAVFDIPVAGTADGNVTVTTPKVSGLSYGCYTWGETMTSTATGTAVISFTKPGVPTETFLNLEPKMVTQTSQFAANPGDEVFDTITVTGTQDTAGEIKATLWGPAKIADAAKCDTITSAMWEKMIADGTVKEVAPAETIAVKGDGVYKTKPVKTDAKALGCYTWSEDAIFDANVDKAPVTANTPPGVIEETTLTLMPKVSTVAKANTALVGATMTDTISVTGLNGEKATITGDILGPLAPNASGTCDGLDWTTAAKAGSIDAIKVANDGTVESSAFTIPTAGCYTYVEKLTVDRNDKVFYNTKAGEPTETLLFAKPPVLTIISGVPGVSANALGVVGGGLVLLLVLGGAGVALVRRNKE